LPELVQLGVQRIACSGSILSSPDPQAAAQQLRDLLPS
jgi:thiamine monophosphate synthase